MWKAWSALIIIFNGMKCICVYENRAFLNAQCNFALIICLICIF